MARKIFLVIDRRAAGGSAEGQRQRCAEGRGLDACMWIPLVVSAISIFLFNLDLCFNFD